MTDRYLHTNETLERLCNEIKQYGTIYIAFDFDNTVFDYHNINDTFTSVERLLKYCKKLGHKLILFTGCENDRLVNAIRYCKEHGYEPDYVNESPIETGTRKPYYNILLDDRAGLYEAHFILTTAIDICKQ